MRRWPRLTSLAPLVGEQRKPRTYRKNARKSYLSVSKQKNPKKKSIRKAIGKQLRFIKRNLGTIDKLLESGCIDLGQLGRYHYRLLLVVNEVYRQQRWMYENRTHQIEDRIVSLSQPHVRPMVRGKASAKVEFGAKLSVSLSQGYCQLDRLSWDAYHEASDLKVQVESYRERYGHYPELVCADQLYRTADNRAWCKQHSIRLSGRPWGRPPTDPLQAKQRRKQIAQDEKARIPIEGKFGQAKRRFSLNLVMSKLANTSETSIFMALIVMNLHRSFLSSFAHFYRRLLRFEPFNSTMSRIKSTFKGFLIHNGTRVSSPVFAH